ncbi:MAG: PQQ-dependent sugar dehydrogenase [Chloroflexia bacterium]
MRYRIAAVTLLCCFVTISLFLSAEPLTMVEAAPPPSDFEDTLVAGVIAPTALAFTPDGRMLITTQQGEVRIYQNGALLTAPAININSRLCTNSERGLLGITVDPNFASNRFIYLYYTFNKFNTCPLGQPTNSSNPVNRASRFILNDNNTINASSKCPG